MGREIPYGCIFESRWSSWSIRSLALLTFFVVHVSRNGFRNKGLEYDLLSGATIAEFLGPSLRNVLMYAWKKRGETLG